MAKAPAKAKTTAVTNWDAELAREAEIGKTKLRSSGGGGKFFSLQAGVLTYDGAPMPGNQMACIILAHVIENSYYEGAFDPDNKAAPKCFAFAEDEDDLEPHKQVDVDPYFERQNDVCNGCPRNEWGSAPVGKGKACKNVMRLSIIPAGVYKKQGTGRNAPLELELFDDVEIFAKAEEAFLKLPVMSVKNFNTYVNGLDEEFSRPPFGMITNVYLEPDPKSQFKVCFEAIDKVPDELMTTIMARHKTAQAGIDFPYSPPPVDEAKPAAKANSKLARRK